MSKIKEGSSGTPIGPFSGMRSEDRAELGQLYYDLIALLGQEAYDITFNQSSIVIKKKGMDGPKLFNYAPYLNSIMEFAKKEGITVHPHPKVATNKELTEGEEFFRPTGQYDPANKKITLYTAGRHPKDVAKSFTHELIHHHQNLEDRINGINTSDTNESQDLATLEEEAYLKGNMLFRKWEDHIKKNGINVLEGK